MKKKQRFFQVLLLILSFIGCLLSIVKDLETIENQSQNNRITEYETEET